MNAFAIGKTTNDLVDALIDDATAIMEERPLGKTPSRSTLVSGARSSRMERMRSTPWAVSTREPAFCDVFGPYHHDSNLGLNAIPSALVQAPNHVLGAIPHQIRLMGLRLP